MWKAFYSLLMHCFDSWFTTDNHYQLIIQHFSVNLYKKWLYKIFQNGEIVQLWTYYTKKYLCFVRQIYLFANCSLERAILTYSNKEVRQILDISVSFSFSVRFLKGMHVTMCFSPPSVSLLKGDVSPCCKKSLTISSAWDSEASFHALNSLNRYFLTDKTDRYWPKHNFRRTKQQNTGSWKATALKYPLGQSLTSQIHVICFQMP